MNETSPPETAFPPNALIISAATTGSWPTKAQNPNVPTTPEEIARAAIDAGHAGAAIVHIHVRDDNEKVTCDPARYARVHELVEAAGSDVIINMSTGGGAGTTTEEERMAPVALAPEIASFDCGSVNFGERVFVNSPTFLRELARCGHFIQPAARWRSAAIASGFPFSRIFGFSATGSATTCLSAANPCARRGVTETPSSSGATFTKRTP